MVTSREIKLCFKFDWMNVKFCNFNVNGDLILFCTARSTVTLKVMNLICVYSIGPENKSTQTRETKCQKIHMIPDEAELVSITVYNKIWLRLNNNLYKYDLLTANTTMVSTNIYEVMVFND